MKTESPTLTIFIPAYNSANYLSQTLESVLSQSFRDFELIIVDDGSADSTLAVAQGYADRDPRVRVIRSPHRGEVAARNKALSAAHPSSRYFLNHDSDDISMPGKLETLVQHLESHPEVAIVGSLAEYFDDAGEDLGKPSLEVSPLSIRKTFHDFNSMVNSASMIRREVFETIGGYREEFRSVDDYDFFMRALLAGASVANIPKVLHRIRIHAGSVGSTRAALQQELAKQIRATYLDHRDSVEAMVIKSPLALSKSYRPARNSRSLRILHTVQMYHPHVGGSEEVVKQLSERLVQLGHHVTIATGFHPDRDFAQWNGVEIRQFRITGNVVHGIQGEFADYQRFVLNGDFDVIVNYAAQIWSSDLVFPLLDKIRARKVFVPCGYSGLFDRAFARYFQGLPDILVKYDRVVHLSENYRDAQFSRQYRLKNSTVIGNAASEEEFLRPSESFRRKHEISTPYLVITVANHYAAKGHRSLLRWFREMKRTDVTLAIIGNKVHGGCWDECVQEARSLPGVVFFEGLPREDVVSAFKDADLFWFGSEVECFPLVILEAMAASTPWLSTDVGNVAELCGGWIAESSRMARKASMLLDSEPLRSDLARQGHEEWKARFTWKHIVDDYETLYRAVCAGDRRGMAGTSKAEAKQNSRRPSITESGLVSVVIPCYNQARYLPEAISSVLEQTYRQFEIIIVDDGSPDAAAQVAQSLIERNPNSAIRLISQKNQGLAASRNAGIRAARGEYILPLDSDDRLKPRFLQSCIDKLASEPQASIVAVDLEEFGDSCARVSCGIPVLERIAVANQINYCSLFRKAIWEKAGGYRTSMRWGYEDWDFWISCLEGGARIALVREHLFLYRKRGVSMYTAALDHDAELQAQMVLNHPGLYEKTTEEWANALFRLKAYPDGGPDRGMDELNAHLVLAKYYASKARWHDALPHLTKLNQASPFSLELVYLAGVAKLKTKDFEEGRRALRTYLDECPDNAGAQFLASLASACLGDLPTAREHAEDAIELDLKMIAGYELLIAVCRAHGDFDAASDCAARCSDLQKQPSSWAFSDLRHEIDGSKKWAELLYQRFLAFAPLPLLELSRTSTSIASAIAKVTAEPETKVSVIMPTYNRPEMLGAAIDSVLAQTMQNFEILVINDAGVDVESVVTQRNASGKISYIRHSHNRGLAAARNTGIKLARGRYIAYLDDDDLFYPDHLQILVHCLENNDCAVAYTDANRAHQVRREGRTLITHKDVPFSSDFSHDRILVGNFIPVLCVAHQKSCFDDVGLFDETLTTHEDWDLWIRLSRKYRFGHIRKTTCEFSWRNDGSSMTSRQQKDFLRTLEIIYGKSGTFADGKPHVLEARSQYLLEKKSLILGQHSLDISGGRVPVSLP